MEEFVYFMQFITSSLKVIQLGMLNDELLLICSGSNALRLPAKKRKKLISIECRNMFVTCVRDHDAVLMKLWNPKLKASIHVVNQTRFQIQ